VYTETPVRQGRLESPWERLVGGCVLGEVDYARECLQRAGANLEEQTDARRLVRSGRVAWDQWDEEAEARTRVVAAVDPNEKKGSSSSGSPGLALLDDTLHYVIYFENDPRFANAPAQELLIEDPLSPQLDWSTFRLSEIAWGNTRVPVPAEAPTLSTRVTVPDHRPDVDRQWWVELDVAVDAAGVARWVFRTLDPATGDLPEDALAGFLPVNDTTGLGEGYVAFSIRPFATLPIGTAITNHAIIVFDTAPPLRTDDVVFHLVDTLPILIRVLSLTDTGLLIEVSGLARGVAATVEWSRNGSDWETLLPFDPEASSVQLTLPFDASGHRAFYRLTQGN
jgi:hypothetical protein